MANTIVPLKLDFAAEKKGTWPSRPCGDWSTFLHPAHRNQGARQSTQAVPKDRKAALFPSPKIQKQVAFGINGFLEKNLQRMLEVVAGRGFEPLTFRL